MTDSEPFPGVRTFPEGTRTAADAALAVGCDVAQIVKSLVFARGDEIVLVLCSGAHTVDAERLGLAKADAARVRDATGYAIGGVPPWNWRQPPADVLIDETLLHHDVVWAAAGTPRTVFPLDPGELVARTGGAIVKVRP